MIRWSVQCSGWLLMSGNVRGANVHEEEEGGSGGSADDSASATIAYSASHAMSYYIGCMCVIDLAWA